MKLLHWIRTELERLRAGRSARQVERPANLQPARSSSSGRRLLRRHVHLGVDFGTCWSKLVLRDYQAPTDRCFVVRPGNAFYVDEDYRIPSSVLVADERLYFGRTGERRDEHVIRSPKMLAAFPSNNDDAFLPVGLTAEDICILAVTYLLQIGYKCAESYCASLSPPATPRMSMSMGVPMSMLDQHRLRNRFLTIARVAFDIWKTEKELRSLADGIDIDQARALIDAARIRTAARPVDSISNWIRSEAEAGLLWIFNSPFVGEGLYGCVDVGAGTTDVSFFRIRDRYENRSWVKDALGFYSARSRPPAMDALDERLATIDGHGVPLARLRGLENTLIKGHALENDERVKSVSRQIHETYRLTWVDAYEKEMQEVAWRRYGLFVLGGGSKVDMVVDSLRSSVWKGRLEKRTIADPGVPVDLFDWPKNGTLSPFRGDATFLLVAYGLSFLGADVPEVDNPSEMPPMRIQQHPRAPIDQDEYYPK